MEEQAKKPVHITWQEAVRAEAEQDKARQARCRSLPPSRLKVITEDVSRDLRKLKASALCLWDVNFNHWLRTWTEMAGANFQTAKNRHEAQAEESRRGQFGDLDVGLKNDPSAMYFTRGPTKSAMASAMAIVLGIILLAGAGTMPYWQRGKNYLSDLTVKWGASAQQDPGHTSDPEVMVEGAKVPPATPQLSSTNHEPVQPDGREITKAGAIAQQGPGHASEPEVTVEGSKLPPATPQLSSTNHQPAQPDGGEITAERAPAYLGKFEVVDNSFVRDRPAANANVIANLRRGTQVMVESKTGEYLRIRSLNDARVSGYVHEQDAFFQAH
ncbi:MAG: hypothetical protein ACXWXT_14025 [Candidatus Binatia bacterium]